MARDLLCLSHLRWDFVFQRPNHLMTRAAADRRVYFIEERKGGTDRPFLERRRRDGVEVLVPHLPDGLAGREADEAMRELVDDLIDRDDIDLPVLWYYTPMALPWTRHIAHSAIVYDSMDHLAGFKSAPASLLHRERELLSTADVVFTGGTQLQAAMQGRHRAVHCFPSSVDTAHFGRARSAGLDPGDQAGIGRPRLGYFGVIDERLDLDLIREVAAMRPEWQVVLVGPIAKIGRKTIPVAPNIHRLGKKTYDELPGYLAGWDVAIMPFAHNEATRFISPTKTPEYLAGGRPVASTSIADVVDPYAALGLVCIGDGADGFIGAAERALRMDVAAHRVRSDLFLATHSWDETWAGMTAILEHLPSRRPRPKAVPAPAVGSPRPWEQHMPVAGSSVGRGQG